ncbi:MAG TPA: beta-ketoacyl synthase N-terminal-like domain-containing protein, partial [Chitinispirillaceae bacterium]|nr:beta-ketoacyl synthase N-terminal-like domain-containing protein [Chitinispirillaceae bacterium]
SLLPAVKDPMTKKLLTDWFTLNYRRLSGNPSQKEVFQFNHQFINQISGLANNRIAQYIQALGPNFQLDAACSSTSTAITLAEEMIKSGRVDRMLIIASDDATSEISLPYLGAGFLSTGATTCEADLYNAAVPFDLRRNGMIMSSGAAAIVVESLSKAEERGIAPVCELLGSHVFNTGSHPARLDVPKYADELDEFIGQMEKLHGISRQEIASKLLYVSHETYTPAQGGCSEAEAFSLQKAFGKDYIQIEVTNTKGMTGHTMGTSIEDVLAARSLQLGKVPPVVNFKVPDPKLQGLKLSKGGSHQCEYALRMAAGFGSQGNYLLMKKWKNGGNERIVDREKYQSWINNISGQMKANLEIAGRVLRIAENGEKTEKSVTTVSIEKKPSVPQPERVSTAVLRIDTAKEVVNVISKITGFPPEMIEEDMEVESDLGIDTVKQATILSTLSEKFGKTDKVDFKISAYPTVRHLIQLFTPEINDDFAADTKSVKDKKVETSVPVVSPSGTINDPENEIIKVISEITGYPPEMIEEDMEVESDLGIDTVKQATILSILAERFGMNGKVDFKISAYPTIGHLIRLFSNKSVSVVNDTSKLPETIIEQVVNKQIDNLPKVQAHVLQFMRSDLRTMNIDISSLSLWILCDDRTKCEGILDYFKLLLKTVEIKQYGTVEQLGDRADIWIDIGMFATDKAAFGNGFTNHDQLHELLGRRFDFCKKYGANPPERILLCRTSNNNGWNSLLQGFYQSVAKEWNAHFSSVEIKQADNVVDYWPFIEMELKTKGDGVRVVYSRTCSLHALTLQQSPFQPAGNCVQR